jgi:hypothetical protein
MDVQDGVRLPTREGCIFRRYNIDYTVVYYDKELSLVYCTSLLDQPRIFNMLPTASSIYEHIRINDVEILHEHLQDDDLYDDVELEVPEPPALVRTPVSSHRTTEDTDSSIRIDLGLNLGLFNDYLTPPRDDRFLNIIHYIRTTTLSPLILLNTVPNVSFDTSTDASADISSHATPSTFEFVPMLEDHDGFIHFEVGDSFRSTHFEEILYTVKATDGFPVHTIECTDANGCEYLFKVLPYGKETALPLDISSLQRLYHHEIVD